MTEDDERNGAGGAVSDVAVWPRFWTGVVVVGVFGMLSSTAIAITAGRQAAADYALILLITAVVGVMVDGLSVSSRRGRR